MDASSVDRAGAAPKGAAGSPDGASLVAWLLAHPVALDDAAILWGDGRIIADLEPVWRTAVGWHRDGGPILIGVTSGDAPDSLLVESFALAATTAAWPPSRWETALGRWWERVGAGLRDVAAERWGVPPEKGGEAAAWTRAAWDREPAPGPAHVGIVAGRVSARLRRAIGWLADVGVAVAAWEARPADDRTFELEAVAGHWEAGAWRPLPGEVGPAAETRFPGPTPAPTEKTDAPGSLMAAIEAVAGEVGAKVVHRGPEWTRIEGRRSLRVFPGRGHVDVQLAGADEGTRVGLQYRFGVGLTAAKWEDGPPGAHVRIEEGDGLDPSVRGLLAAWLGGPPEESEPEG